MLIDIWTSRTWEWVTPDKLHPGDLVIASPNNHRTIYHVSRTTKDLREPDYISVLYRLEYPNMDWPETDIKNRSELFLTYDLRKGQELKRFITPFKNDLKPQINSHPMYRLKIIDIYKDIICTPREYQTYSELMELWKKEKENV